MIKNDTNLADNYNFKRLSREGERTWDDIVNRLISELIKRGAKTSREDFEWLMLNYYALPNSPALLTAGTEQFAGSACSSYPVYDMMTNHRFSILNSLGLGVRALKAGIGVGWNFSNLRSKQERVQGRIGVTGGPVSFLRSFDGFISGIQQLTRRAACMGLLHVNHPDIEDYIKVKSIDGEISNFNLSVVLDDKFMRAVEGGDKYNLYWRNEKRDPVEVDARKLFDLMCESAWKTGEPGFMFEDTIKKDYFEYNDKLGILANPCSEALLSWGEDWLELCVLGSINLPKYVVMSDQDRKRVVHTLVSLLNDIIDTQDYICEEHRRGAKELNRKIGVGVAGLATVLAERGIKYSSQESYDFSKKLFEEIGRFAHEKSSHLGNVNKLGRYNSSLLSVAPTSTISRIYDYVNEQGCSWGIEPYFDIKPQIIKNSYGEFVQKEKIVDYLRGETSHIETANELDYKQHLVPLEAYYNSCPVGYVQGVSKTINFKNNVTIEDVKKSLFYCWEKKVKAISFYRDGSRKNQVINSIGDTNCEECRPEKIVYRGAPKRPEKLPCDIYHVQSDNEKWLVLIGLLDGEVYEIFAGLEEKIRIPWKYNSGFILKNKTYHLIVGSGDDELIIRDVPEMFESREHASLTRLISMSLRHGVPLKFCMEQLLKDGEMNALNKAIGRVLKKYIKEKEGVSKLCPTCGNSLYYVSGCPTCVSCGYSKCS